MESSKWFSRFFVKLFPANPSADHFQQYLAVPDQILNMQSAPSHGHQFACNTPHHASWWTTRPKFMVFSLDFLNGRKSNKSEKSENIPRPMLVSKGAHSWLLALKKSVQCDSGTTSCIIITITQPRFSSEAAKNKNVTQVKVTGH